MHLFELPSPRLALLAAAAGMAGCSTSTGPTAASTHPAGVIASTISLGGRPHGVAIAANGEFCVSRIDVNILSCGALTATDASVSENVPVGLTPAHVALSASGGLAYTANQSGNTMSTVDVAGARVSSTVPLSDGGFNVLADPDRSRVYVTTASGLLHVVDDGQVVARVQLGAASNGLALDRSASLLYVSSIQAGTVTAINTATNAIARTYQVSGSPQRIALSADGHTLYIASEAVGLEILDLPSGGRSIVAGVSPGAVGLALSPDGAQVYVANPPAGLLQIVNTSRRELLLTINGLASPRNVAFGLSGAAALVTAEGGGVYVIR